jgi:uncharacterized protein
MTMSAIDVHGHFGAYEDGRGQNSLTGTLFSGDIGTVRARAQAAGVRLTVVSALRAFMPYGGDPLRGNDDARLAAEATEGILFWAVLDPRRRETYAQVEELLRHPHCCGIKLHPHRQQYEIRQHGDAVYEFAAAHRALILTHSGDPGSYPEDFIPFANRHSATRTILAHLGNSDDGAAGRQVHAIQQSEAGNVYVDTSSARSIFSGLIEWAVAEIGAERILFGTDTPLYDTATQKARIETAAITEEARRAILHDNAARLLRELAKPIPRL